MNKFFSVLGRVGHIAVQFGLLGLNGYVAYANGGKVGAVNYAVSAIQVLMADQAFAHTPAPKPDPMPPPNPPK